MRYLLLVGFACDVYRREPRARIFVGDQLVDEFFIPHTTSHFLTSKQEFKKKLHPLQPYDSLLWIKNHSPLKFYELQIDDAISNLDIRIHVDNHDSNHSNGYMTRSTLIRLETCAFFPLEEKVLQTLKKIRDRRRISKNYAWYKADKNLVFDLTVNNMCWQGANGQKITSTPNQPYLCELNIGGDGAYVCELYKKYGILMTTLARPCRHSFNYPIIKYFLDKYCQYAHQRNSN